MPRYTPHVIRARRAASRRPRQRRHCRLHSTVAGHDVGLALAALAVDRQHVAPVEQHVVERLHAEGHKLCVCVCVWVWVWVWVWVCGCVGVCVGAWVRACARARVFARAHVLA